MVSLSDVRAHNATLRSLPAGLVAVFVGGTSGIGLFTAREFVRNTTSPHVYLIGRNATEASKIIQELRTINTSSQVSFIQKDVSLLKNVDEACQEIKSKEKQVNLLFMTCGYLTFQGRDETAEGLDRKFALHYRVVAVLDPQIGLRFTPNFSDLALQSSFSLKNCGIHASAMTSLAVYHLAKEYPTTTFIHAYPSGVETGVFRELFGRFERVAKSLLLTVASWMIVPQGESGERHLFAATAPRYAPQAIGGNVEGAAVGSDGVKGSGSYLLNWNGDILADRPKAKSMRESGKEKVVWEHTEEVFKKICDEGGKY
ncbi:uncharacterized protein K460DRAFT_409100 [Cucurbitaria berberidis CBS 394.84]|uniref:NAD(P)-binding protein n=1 Tax=Cucurbitaria berberidis CBS 394.84 TaxID=1168544 RepID=A0A9P4L4T4_9PLEO|nr:uncharacterized protein K460DRAFT_409100 [Cucurbitaria berberidis CBS 394.84]KAF1841642.1 hypothetical protein K460DRAFT_409100 [Cucurbitaria berberidis CBS 394.84]